MGYYCNVCKKDITKGEFSYSMDKFGRILCREHQEAERTAQEKSSHFESPDSSDEIDVEDAPKTGWKSLGKVAKKMGKGVKQGVKKISASSKKLIQIRKWKDAILRRMTMSQLKSFCFENKINTKKVVLSDDERSDEIYFEKVECTQGDLVSKLKNKAPLDVIISFAKRNRIDIKDILKDIEQKKIKWENKDLDKNGEEKDLKLEHRWRIEVLTRDKHTCRVCGKMGANSAHHIYSRKYCQKNDAPELEWDFRNGIAVCYECHKNITVDGRKWFFEENEKYYKNG